MLKKPHFLLVPVLLILILPVQAMATQNHGGLEGLYVHQLAHLFFAIAMGLLIFWLRKWRLTISASWRFIQYAAILFIVWNMDAIAAHWLLEQSGLVAVETVSAMRVRIVTSPGWQWLSPIYYVTKLDHLLCVPAMVFLLLGLKRLLQTVLPPGSHGKSTP